MCSKSVSQSNPVELDDAGRQHTNLLSQRQMLKKAAPLFLLIGAESKARASRRWRLMKEDAVIMRVG